MTKHKQLLGLVDYHAASCHLQAAQVGLLSILLCFILARLSMAGEPPRQQQYPPLRELAKARGMYIGAAVAVEPLLKSSQYQTTLAREFNMVTAENALKFDATHPARERYTFEGADAIVAFAQQHKMKVRGHTLVWHAALPSWVSAGKFSQEEMKTILREHIHTLVKHYRGKLYCWDVVNEGLVGDGSLRKTVWAEGIGPDYMDWAFRWAHETDPKAKLFYNDYAVEELNAKSDAMYKMVKDMLKRGVPIHGVGLQMHISSLPSIESLAANIKRFNDLGLEVHITELDVATRLMKGTQEEKLAEQARIYRSVMQVCLAAKNVKAFVMWGFTDAHSWLARYEGRQDFPLPFDTAYQPKPAYYALADALAKKKK
jgi:endo-1,4-beta-xylanase